MFLLNPTQQEVTLWFKSIFQFRKPEIQKSESRKSGRKSDNHKKSKVKIQSQVSQDVSEIQGVKEVKEVKTEVEHLRYGGSVLNVS